MELTQTRVGLAPLLRIEDRISVRRRRADLPAIRGLLAVKKGDRLLDVGGGTGALSAVIGGEGAKAVVLEPNPRKVAFGRSRHPQVEYHEAFAERMPFPDGSFDCAMAMLSFHHTEDPERALREVHRVLAPSGKFLIQEFHPAVAPGALARRLFARRHGGHHRYYEPDGMKASLGEAGFRDIVVHDGKRTYYVLAIR